MKQGETGGNRWETRKENGGCAHNRRGKRQPLTGCYSFLLPRLSSASAKGLKIFMAFCVLYMIVCFFVGLYTPADRALALIASLKNYLLNVYFGQSLGKSSLLLLELFFVSLSAIAPNTASPYSDKSTSHYSS